MTSKKKIVVLSGAGVSAESGVKTFRDDDGLWEGHDVMQVASPEGWAADMDLVLEFYNQRRKQALEVQPNLGHKIIADLENDFEVSIVTQNVDNLHERAGSTQVMHLHGELFKCRSTLDDNLIYDMEGWELKKGDLCEKGAQLRPHIVWFGEMVPLMDDAIQEVQSADVFIVIGTSLVVYPAAGLIHHTKPGIPIFVIDPKLPDLPTMAKMTTFEEGGSTGMKKVVEMLKSIN